MSGRVKVDCRVRVERGYKLSQLAHVFFDRQYVASSAGVFAGQIHALLLHPRHAEFAVAIIVHIDVEPESIYWISPADFLNLPDDIAVVRSAGGGAKALPAKCRLRVSGLRIEVQPPFATISRFLFRTHHSG